MSIFFKDKKTKYIEPESYPGAKKTRGQLAGAAESGALERLERSGEQYGGPLVAALSKYEQTGLDQLGTYLDQPLPSEGTLYTSAVDEITKTLAGDYDPSKSEYYQAYKNAVMRELEESKDRLKASTSARDKYFGGGRIATEGELEESAVGDLALIMGQLAEQERMNRLNVLDPALQYSQFAEAAPMTRIAASQEFGDLPRLIEQAEMDADYQEWMRALNDLGIALDTATGLATYQPGIMVEQKGGGMKNWLKDLAVGSALFTGATGQNPFLV